MPAARWITSAPWRCMARAAATASTSEVKACALVDPSPPGAAAASTKMVAEKAGCAASENATARAIIKTIRIGCFIFSPCGETNSCYITNDRRFLRARFIL